MKKNLICYDTLELIDMDYSTYLRYSRRELVLAIRSLRQECREHGQCVSEPAVEGKTKKMLACMIYELAEELLRGEVARHNSGFEV